MVSKPVFNKASKAWLLNLKPGFTCFALFHLLILLYACSQSRSKENKEEKRPPVTQLIASLEDEVRDLPDGQISWSTYWKLCWAAYPDAQAYEIQIFTSEGASPKLKKQSDTCYRIQVATGINKKEQGMFNRQQLVKLQSRQLGYKIRAVLNDTQVSEWSVTAWLGETSK